MLGRVLIDDLHQLRAARKCGSHGERRGGMWAWRLKVPSGNASGSTVSVAGSASDNSPASSNAPSPGSPRSSEASAPVDKLSVLIDIAKVLHVKVETLSGRPFALAPNGDPELDGMAAIQDALASYPGLGVTTPPPAKLADIERLTTEVHLRYQSADYGAATRILPSLIRSVDGLVAESRGDERRRALELQSSVYVAAAKLVTKVGNAELAWLTADRAAGAALHADSPTLGASAAYQLACAFLKNDRLDEAEHIALVTAENLDDDSPAGLSLRGALTLIAADIAGRRNDRGEALRTPPARAAARRPTRRGREPRLDRLRPHQRRHPPRLHRG